jgi:hypothetical protein
MKLIFDLLIDGGMSAAMSYGSDLTGDIRRGPLCRADGIRAASVEPADGLQYWDHACPGAHALDVVELTVVDARSTIKQSPPSATNLGRVQTIQTNLIFFFIGEKIHLYSLSIYIDCIIMLQMVADSIEK